MPTMTRLMRRGRRMLRLRILEQLTWDLYTSSAAVATIGGAGAGELVFFRAGRMPGAAADTLTAAASLLGVMISYGRI